VRFGDIGRALDGVENDRIASWFSGDRAIVLAVQRQPGTNTVEVVDAVKALLERSRAQLPASVKLDVLIDRSQSIRESVADVKFTLLLTVALVVMVIFLFLRNLSATLIPSLALPMSIVGTFAVMALLGYSLDNFSLMALTLSVGFVVDDAIVMLENIVRHMEEAEGALQAALSGSREIGFTILSMTLSLVAVFVPVLFMGGLMGRLLHEFAVTIAAAILVSGFVSLTLTPMLCSRFLKHAERHAHGRLYQASERVFERGLALYERTLRMVMRHQRATLAASVALLLVTGWMFAVVPTGFLPSDDTGLITATTEAAQGISFQSMAEHQQALARIVGADPNVAAYMSSVGAGGPNASANGGRLVMRLKPRSERRLSADG
jgi:HAE1 family hydrophobic/amphiphilic exporter-1